MTKVALIENDQILFKQLDDQLSASSQHDLEIQHIPFAKSSDVVIDHYDAFLVYFENLNRHNPIKFIRHYLSLKIQKPILIVTESNLKHLDIELLKLGVDDCIPADELSIKLLLRSIRYAKHRKTNESRLAFLSTHDQLTGLANRYLMQQHLLHSISVSKRTQSHFAILLLDIDKFKLFNDSMGHDCGDSLLISVSQRLENCLRETDILARFGNDEFAILLENYGKTHHLESIVEKIQYSLEKPIVYQSQEFYITTSIGVATFPECGNTTESLLKSADAALYQAKKLGRNQSHFFSGDLNHQARLKLELEKHLRRALINGEFEIYLQPQIDPATARVAGAEALLRWQHPTKGTISPAVFIPLLEDLGLLSGVEAWVLNQVCNLATSLIERHGEMRFSVNISGAHFKTGNLKENIFLALQSSSLDANFLEVELTEDIMIEHVERNSRLLNELKELGISIALDDFGKGYSSLSYLKNFPADILKIDKAFIDHLVEDKRDTAIVESLVELAHKLDIKVVAEGVERKNQLGCLKELGCDFVQGYYYSKPISVSEFENFIAQQNTNKDSNIAAFIRS